ncbi:hypothetical protein [Sphingorhabdus sp.]|uniref:hypothetical protein n=1 Tax=Sphingorhabdus sp. TaxID=1902408 RepID=UPI004048B1B1
MTFGSQIHVDQLHLIRSPNIGPVSYRQLMSRLGSAKATLRGYLTLCGTAVASRWRWPMRPLLEGSFKLRVLSVRDMCSRVMLTIRSCYRTSTMRR